MGRRASYLNPIRIYIFTSAFFFLIFFSFYQQQEAIVNTSSTTLLTDLKKSKVTLAEKLQKNLSPEEKKEIEVEIKNTEDDIAMLEKDSTATDKLKTANYSFNVISFKSDDEKRLYKTLKEYDSMQKTLSKNKRDGFIVGRLERQNLYLKEKYNNDSRKIFKSIFENFIHRFPQMLFVSLPLFAFILWLLYIRRKNFFYVNHAIYAVHLYCASFIFILTGLWLSSIFSWFGKDFPKWIITLFTLSSIFYLYKAQRNFYGQSRTKTIFKFILLMLASLIIMVILFAVFFIFSTFSA